MIPKRFFPVCPAALLLCCLLQAFSAKAQTPGYDSAAQAYTSSERKPEFPGLGPFIADKLRYPDFANRNGIEGRVVVGFVVDTNGSISRVKVLKSVHSTLDSEAVRLVRLMKSWKPGARYDSLQKKTIPVKTLFSLPIRFRTDQWSAQDPVSLDSCSAHFVGPRSAAYGAFPEYTGDLKSLTRLELPSMPGAEPKIHALVLIRKNGSLEFKQALCLRNPPLEKAIEAAFAEKLKGQGNPPQWIPARQKTESGLKEVDCPLILELTLAP